MTAEADTRGLAADLMRERDALFAGLTPDEARVITGLVKAMRESIVEARNAIRGEDAYESLGLADGALLEARQALNWLPPDEVPATHAASDAAWHIAHAISLMGES